jgi:hypothetical protein
VGSSKPMPFSPPSASPLIFKRIRLYFNAIIQTPPVLSFAG